MSEHGPTINLGVHSWCAWHLAPFKKDWPSGFGVATVLLAQAAIALPAVTAGLNPLLDGDALTAALNARMGELAPLCCAVDEAIMRSIYEQAGSLPWPDTLMEGQRTRHMRGVAFERMPEP